MYLCLTVQSLVATEKQQRNDKLENKLALLEQQLAESDKGSLKKLQELKDQAITPINSQVDRLELVAKEEKQVKEKFLEFWDKEIKRLDQKIDEGFAVENTVGY